MRPNEDIKKILKDHPYYIFNIENPSDELISIALEKQKEQNLHVMINLIPKVDQDKFLDRLSLHKMMMVLVKNKSPKLQHLMVSQFPETIFTIDDPCEEAQIEVAHKQPELIQYLKHRCLEAHRISMRKRIFSKIFESIIILISAMISWWFPIDSVKFIRKHPHCIRGVSNLTTEQQLAAVQSNPYCIAFIEHPNYTVQKYMFKNHSDICLCMMRNIDEKIQLRYIYRNPLWIAYIKNPSVTTQLTAVANCSELLYYVNNPSLIITPYLLGENPKLIALIKNPTYRQELDALRRGLSFYDFVNPSNAIIMDIIALKPYIILYVQTPSLDMISRAVQLDSHLGIIIDTASEEDQFKIVKKNPTLIRYISNPSQSIQMEVFRQCPKYSLLIKNPSQSVKDCAIQNDPNYNDYFQNPDSLKSQKFLYKNFLKPFLPTEFVCAICITDEDDDTPNCQPTRKLRCGHIFHTDCIRPWIYNHINCPVCRKSIL